jgi:hypothetical protein
MGRFLRRIERHKRRATDKEQEGAALEVARALVLGTLADRGQATEAELIRPLFKATRRFDVAWPTLQTLLCEHKIVELEPLSGPGGRVRRFALAPEPDAQMYICASEPGASAAGGPLR